MRLDFGAMNILAILASGVVSMVLGFLWYGPLFGKAWAGYTGWTEERVKALPASNMAKTYLLAFLAALLQAFTLAVVSRAVGAVGAGDGLLLGLLAGIGLVAMGFATTYLFDRKPLKLWLIVAGYEVVYLAVAGILVAAWR